MESQHRKPGHRPPSIAHLGVQLHNLTIEQVKGMYSCLIVRQPDVYLSTVGGLPLHVEQTRLIVSLVAETPVDRWGLIPISTLCRAGAGRLCIGQVLGGQESIRPYTLGTALAGPSTSALSHHRTAQPEWRRASYKTVAA